LQTLRKVPEKLTRSTQRNVTWQTDSEYCRLTAPSDRTLNCISFVRKIQIQEIFGSPIVYGTITPRTRSTEHNLDVCDNLLVY